MDAGERGQGWVGNGTFLQPPWDIWGAVWLGRSWGSLSASNPDPGFGDGSWGSVQPESPAELLQNAGFRPIPRDALLPGPAWVWESHSYNKPTLGLQLRKDRSSHPELSREASPSRASGLWLIKPRKRTGAPASACLPVTERTCMLQPTFILVSFLPTHPTVQGLASPLNKNCTDFYIKDIS